MKNRKEMISLIAKFIEEIKKEATETVSVKQFSPQKWFKDKGISDHVLVAKIVTILSKTVIQREGSKSTMSFKWIGENVNSKSLAEITYDQCMAEHVEVKHNILSLDDKVYVIFDNKICMVSVVGIQRTMPYKPNSELIVNVYRESPNFPIELSSDEVYKDINQLIEHLREQVLV